MSSFSWYAMLAALVITGLGGLLLARFGALKYEQGKSDKIIEVMKEQKAGELQYEKKKIEVRYLDDDALVRRYCRWVYDISYAECVRATHPIP